jgi:hypothetical protein
VILDTLIEEKVLKRVSDPEDDDETPTEEAD